MEDVYDVYEVSRKATALQGFQWRRLFEDMEENHPEMYRTFVDKILSEKIIDPSVSNNAKNFVRHIRLERPEWYVSGSYVEFQIVYQEFKKFSGLECPYEPAVSRCLHKIIDDRIHKNIGIYESPITYVSLRPIDDL